MVEAYVPKNLKEALEMLHEKSLRIVAGGTDMLIQNRNRSGLPINFKSDILYVFDLEELKRIEEDSKFLYIGASCSLESILENELTPKLLKMTILEMASPAIRNTGTLAGNIANASPAGDGIVTLVLEDALLEIQSINHLRKEKVQNFIQGVRKINLNPDELITKIVIPKVTFDKAYFKKVGPRLSDAISKVAFAGAIKFEDTIVKDFRICLGAVNIKMVRDSAIEKKYIGKTKKELQGLIPEILTDYFPLIKPIDDQRSNKEYRKQVSLNLIQEFIENL
jgi:CO/xanthine dehydrogenase FAD-binding subunit